MTGPRVARQTKDPVILSTYRFNPWNEGNEIICCAIISDFYHEYKLVIRSIEEDAVINV